MTSCLASGPRRVASAAAATMVVLVTGGSVTAVSHAQEERSIQDGVYTAAQAARGEHLYKQLCVPCHGAQWTAPNAAPGSTGDDFLAKFDGKTVGALFEKILNTMPGSDPGILIPSEVAELIAFLASSSQVPAGQTELPSDPVLLRQIRIVKKLENRGSGDFR